MDAILWDYDGTLVNSVPKNISITKEILSIVAPHLTGSNLPIYLQSEAAYREANHSAKNWQALYRDFYGLTDAETIKAGSLWARHQLENETAVEFFCGIRPLIAALASLPHGVCSQNSSENIWRMLHQARIAESFRSVIGYDSIGTNLQKPSPESGIKCLAEIFDDYADKTVLYVGDHEADVRFARNLDNRLGSQASVISVAVSYSGGQPQQWQNGPDFILAEPLDLLEICQQFTW